MMLSIAGEVTVGWVVRQCITDSVLYSCTGLLA